MVSSQVEAVQGSYSKPTVTSNSEETWRVCGSLKEWEQIHEEKVNLLIWKRECPEVLVQGLKDVIWDELPGERFVSHVNDISESLTKHFSSLSLDANVRDMWLEDMVILCKRFSEIIESPTFRVRLDKLSDDGCRRFHNDNSTVRLLCTYIGPTTEWLPGHLLHRVPGKEDVFKEENIRHVPRLSVALCKGIQHPTYEEKLYHRSPQIAKAGLRRFVLCLDIYSRADRAKANTKKRKRFFGMLKNK